VKDTMVKIWCLDTGAVLFNLEGHNAMVDLLVMSHNHLVSASLDRTLRIWDPDNGQYQSTLFAPEYFDINDFQHDAQKVISGCGALRIWKVDTGEFIRDLITITTDDHDTNAQLVQFDERRCVAIVWRNMRSYIEVGISYPLPMHLLLLTCLLRFLTLAPRLAFDQTSLSRSLQPPSRHNSQPCRIELSSNHEIYRHVLA
jgi:WD40 repeat protein